MARAGSSFVCTGTHVNDVTTQQDIGPCCVGISIHNAAVIWYRGLFRLHACLERA